MRGTRLSSVERFATATDVVRRGTAGPSAPAEAVGRDDTSKDSAGSRGMRILARIGVLRLALKRSLRMTPWKLMRVQRRMTHLKANAVAARESVVVGRVFRNCHGCRSSGEQQVPPLRLKPSVGMTLRKGVRAALGMINPRENRGPSTPLRSAQDDTLEINAACARNNNSRGRGVRSVA